MLNIKIRIILIIILVITVKSWVLASSFNLMPMNIHFLGSVTSGRNIIAYGSNGAYMLTTDQGKTWKRHSIADFGNISDIVNFKDTLWGIFDSGYLLRSVDNGQSWFKKQFNLNKDDYYTKLLVTDKYIYIRTLKEILRFDKNFNLLNSIQDTLFESTFGTADYFQLGVNKYFLNEFFYLNGQIIINVMYKYRDGFAVMSEDLSEIKLIPLKDKIYINKTGIYLYYVLNDIFNYNGKPVFKINQDLYLTNNDFSKWCRFFPDTSFLNPNEPLFSKKWPYRDYMPDTYYMNNNNLFMGSWNDNSNYAIRKYSYDGTNCRFDLYNNFFKSKYYTPKFTNDDHGSIENTYIGKNTVLEDSIIVKVNSYGTIIQTLNDCKSWELYSSLNGTPKFILNDSTYIFSNDGSKKNDIYRSNNYGISFMPTELELDTATIYTIIKDSTGKFDTVSMKLDTLTYFSNFGSTSVFYMDNNGKSFWGAPTADDSPFKFNCAFSYDFGKRYKFANVDKLWYGSISLPVITSNIEQISGHYIYSNTNENRYKNKYYGYIYLFDTSLKIPATRIKDSLMVVHHILADNLKHYLMLTNAQDPNAKDSIGLNKNRFEIKETNDSGFTYKTICYIDHELKIDQIYEHNKDTVFFTTLNPCRLYLYDRIRNAFDTLFKDNDSQHIKVMNLSNKFYICGQNLFLENSERSDLTKWQPSKWDYGTPTFESVIFKGNVAIAKLTDSLRPLNYYRIMINKTTDVKDEIKTDILYYNNHFYASAPYPLPSINSVTAKISYDMSFDLWEAISGVYDVNGELIEGKQNITLKNQSKAYAELVWNCTSVPNGNYFIVVNHNGISDCIPVIVGK
ncbi:MAG: hypothetical protein NT007_01380 [Candidatus Kapabacteria bacterium]|nr:hypothetical protein [Candidatus Kapabacteria bacterium]